MENIHILGVDLAKRTFAICGADNRGYGNKMDYTFTNKFINHNILTKCPYRFLSIHLDIIPRSRKHSCGISRRLMRAILSAKPTCLDEG
jgi:hypothetical protein